MNISIIGTGYVGLVTGTCFSDFGNQVVCIDTNENKIEALKKGIIPIYEPGLEDMVQRNVAKGRLHFVSDSTKIDESDICFICVGTPPGEDGSADLSYVLAVAKTIGQNITKHITVVDKSTVPVGTADLVRRTIQEELDKRNADIDFDVISNPEFLKEGTAISDFMRPDRIVIGVNNRESEDVMRALYKPFLSNPEQFIVMDILSAEMTKYAANSMLATKISFINELSNICDKVGANINNVRLGIGSDKRIGYSFIYPGCGYGGSCFPKDVKALISTAQDFGYEAKLLQSVDDVNNQQKKVLFDKVMSRFGKKSNSGGHSLDGLTFAVWGLSFKPETDDMREASSITLIKLLTSEGAKVRAYDPKAIDEAKNIYLKDVNGIEYFESKEEALKYADAMILVTEWKEFRSPDFKTIKTELKNPIIFDGRNQYDSNYLKENGFEYYQIGVGK